MKLRIIDDDNPTTTLLKTFLADENYEIEVQNTSDDSLDVIKQTRPDAILLDVIMPKKIGLELCAEIRTEAEFKNNPIMIISALGDIDHKVKAYENGATDYLTKPIHPQESKSLIRNRPS
jgi:two-component system sensor histidine kinase ChiS